MTPAGLTGAVLAGVGLWLALLAGFALSLPLLLTGLGLFAVGFGVLALGGEQR